MNQQNVPVCVVEGGEQQREEADPSQSSSSIWFEFN